MGISTAPRYNLDTNDFDDSPQNNGVVGAVIVPAVPAAAVPFHGHDVPSLPGTCLLQWKPSASDDGASAIPDLVGSYDLALDAPFAPGAEPWAGEDTRYLEQPGIIGAIGSLVSTLATDSFYVMVFLRYGAEAEGGLFDAMGNPGAATDSGRHVASGKFYPASGDTSRFDFGQKYGEELVSYLDPAAGVAHLAMAWKSSVTRRQRSWLNGVPLGDATGAHLTTATDFTAPVFAVLKDIYTSPNTYTGAVNTGIADFVLGLGEPTDADVLYQATFVGEGAGGGSDPVFDEPTPTLLDDHNLLDPATLVWTASGHKDARTAAETAAFKNSIAAFDHLGRARVKSVAAEVTGPVAGAVVLTDARGFVPQSLIDPVSDPLLLILGGG